MATADDICSIGMRWINLAHLDWVDMRSLEQHPHPIYLYFAGRSEPLVLEAGDARAFLRHWSDWLGLNDDEDDEEDE